MSSLTVRLQPEISRELFVIFFISINSSSNVFAKPFLFESVCSIRLLANGKISLIITS